MSAKCQKRTTQSAHSVRPVLTGTTEASKLCSPFLRRITVVCLGLPPPSLNCRFAQPRYAHTHELHISIANEAARLPFRVSEPLQLNAELLLCERLLALNRAPILIVRPQFGCPHGYPNSMLESVPGKGAYVRVDEGGSLTG